MNKIKLSFSNPKLDFFVKSYIAFILIPFLSAFTFIFALSRIGNIWGLWEREGILGLYIWGSIGGIIFYFLGILLAVILIAIFNKKFMSGDRVPKFNRFPRLTLFVLSFLAYILTSYIIGLFLR